MSAAMKSRLFLLYAMSLLDDFQNLPPSQEKSYDKILEEITLATLLNPTQKPKKAAAANPPAQAPQVSVKSSQSILTQQRKPSVTFKKIFQSSPSFQDLLKEYNRFHQHSSPIKSTPAGKSAPAQASDFRFDRVEMIRISQIPGKIIRPTKPTKRPPTSC